MLKNAQVKDAPRQHLRTACASQQALPRFRKTVSLLSGTVAGPCSSSSRAEYSAGHQYSAGWFRRRALRAGRRRGFRTGHKLSVAQRALTVCLTVSVEPASGNSRCCYAGINISAPVESVWGALTDYERLGTFIPGLAENRCLSRHAQGARLLQVGEQSVALGAKFRAEVILDIQEYRSGLPASMCAIATCAIEQSSTKFPCPRGLAKEAARDLTFQLVKGDFQVFSGVWRMQQRQAQKVTYLSYALYVRPQMWLPVRLIQGRIQSEIQANMCAVQQHSEALWRAEQTRAKATVNA